MSLIKEVEQLEVNMFETLAKAYECINHRNRDDAKAYIAVIEVLNEDYKEITKVDFVKPSVILDLYERMWKNAQ